MNRMIFNICYLFCCLGLCIPVSAGTIYVDLDATGGNTGRNWTDAYTSLSTAIEKTSPGDEIWVAEGRYAPIVLKNGVKVYGGFAGTETSASASDPDTHKTYISGGGKSRAVQTTGSDSSTMLRGFYVTDGFIDVPETGGGVYLENSSAIFVRCVFTGNKATVMGGAVAIWGGSPTFVNCRFYDNDGGWAAGAVFNRRSATPTFANCLFYENKAWEAGAIAMVTGAPTFVNCTLSDNQATIGKGGALFDTRGEAVLRNCILWNNVAGVTGTHEIFNLPGAGGTTAVAYSDIKGGWSGDGNIASDPLFVDVSKNDYHLQSGSPCTSAGQRSLLPPDIGDIDWDGDTAEALPADLGLSAPQEDETVGIGAYWAVGP